MGHKTIDTEQGHWLLAKMGKKVLRPGGRELTETLLKALDIHKDTKVVEFAPGIGFTASLIFDKKPKSYTGVEINQEAATNLQKKFTDSNHVIVNRSASDSGLESDTYDRVLGEAMLTMQSEARKSEIISEAYRILQKGGLYGIHELGLQPDELDSETKKEILTELAKTIKVNARPMTKSEWIHILEREGFKVEEAYKSPMLLLEPKRIIEDEGIAGAMQIGYNMFANPEARKKIMEMRDLFRKHKENLTAFAIIARK